MYAKAQVIGNLGRDPETRYTKSGAMNVSFSVAASRRFNDASGTLQERTTWFRVTAWGKLAETLDRLAQDGALAKGQRVFVAGRLEADEFTGNDGQKRTSLEINADDVLLMSPRGEGGGQGGYGASRSSQQPAAVAEDVDDLPF
jgi:single-strand DNA-binding protein